MEGMGQQSILHTMKAPQSLHSILPKKAEQHGLE